MNNPIPVHVNYCLPLFLVESYHKRDALLSPIMVENLGFPDVTDLGLSTTDVDHWYRCSKKTSAAKASESKKIARPTVVGAYLALLAFGSLPYRTIGECRARWDL